MTACNCLRYVRIFGNKLNFAYIVFFSRHQPALYAYGFNAHAARKTPKWQYAKKRWQLRSTQRTYLTFPPRLRNLFSWSHTRSSFPIASLPVLTRCNRSLLFIFVFRCASRSLNKFRLSLRELFETIVLCDISHGIREMKIGRGEFEIRRGDTKYFISHAYVERRDKFSLYIQFNACNSESGVVYSRGTINISASRVGGYQATWCAAPHGVQHHSRQMHIIRRSLV